MKKEEETLKLQKALLRVRWLATFCLENSEMEEKPSGEIASAFCSIRDIARDTFIDLGISSSRLDELDKLAPFQIDELKKI